MLAAPAARAGTGRWTSYGPPEGTVNAIALDPANQATVYAGTSYARVFKSTNRGSSWRVRDQGLPVNTFVNALAVDPAHTNSVYAGTNAGLFNVTASEPALASASTRHMSRPSRHSDPASWMGGTQIWRRYVGVPDTLTGSNAIATSPDGSKVFVTGWSIVDNDAYATFALDLSSGRRLWTAMYRGPSGGGDEARAIGVSPDGSRVFVTGESVGQSGTNDDYATIAYDASTGARLWVARYNYGPAYNFDFANSLTVSPDGARVFVTGGSCREPSYECNSQTA